MFRLPWIGLKIVLGEGYKLKIIIYNILFISLLLFKLQTPIRP